MTDQARERLRATIHGRVQGVGFRDFTEGRAETLGVTGWVRNRADGSVEVVAEGRRDALEALLHDLRRGPPHALVIRVEVEWDRPSGEFPDFRTSYDRS